MRVEVSDEGHAQGIIVFLTPGGFTFFACRRLHYRVSPLILYPRRLFLLILVWVVLAPTIFGVNSTVDFGAGFPSERLLFRSRCYFFSLS